MSRKDDSSESLSSDDAAISGHSSNPASVKSIRLRTDSTPTEREIKLMKKRSYGHIAKRLDRLATAWHYKTSPEDYDVEVIEELNKMKRLDIGARGNEDDIHAALEHLKAICRPLTIRRMIKHHLFSGKIKNRGVSGMRNCLKKKYWKMKLQWNEYKYKMQIWATALRWIEGRHGVGVLSYFVFLRWMLGLNVLLSLLIIMFLTVPTRLLPQSDYYVQKKGPYISLALNCSRHYFYKPDLTVRSVANGFFQGTGWMERTPVFYGFYPDFHLMNWAGIYSFYDIASAYLLVSIVCFGISLVLMVMRTTSSFRQSVILMSYDKYCNTVFASWDHNIRGYLNTAIKQRSIYFTIQSDLEEERFKKFIEEMETKLIPMMILYLKRTAVNLFVVLCLCASAYLIYFATRWSTSFHTEGQSSEIILLSQFLPSMTLTALNAVIPVIFSLIVQLESYSQSVIIKLTLIRTVFLRLASLAVLVASLYMQIICKPRDSCQTGIKPCVELQCWETYVGQQFYKLMMLNFFVTVFKVFYYEIPRRLLTVDSGSSLAQKLGPCYFDIAGNVLDLIYTQTIVWLGFFFAPMLPMFAVIHLVFVFYSKMVSALYACDIEEKPYRASRSNTFFVVILMLAFLLCVLPVGYAISSIIPSRGCGPFRTHDKMYEAIAEAMEYFPSWIKIIFNFILSPIFGLCFIVILILGLYYSNKNALAQKDYANTLRNDLILECKARQALSRKLNYYTKFHTDNM